MRPPRGAMKGGRGAPRGKGGRGGRGGGFRAPEGPPDRVEAVGAVMHACEGDIVCKLTHTMIPYFNASIYVDKDTRVGKVDEIFGPINEVYFTVKPEANAKAESFKAEDVLSIDPMKLLPLSRFTSGGGGGGGGGRGKGGKGKGKGGRGKGGGKGRGKGGGKGKGRGGKGGRGSPGGRGRGRGRGY